MPPTDTDNRLNTIRALLAKAEATEFAAEAEAFTAKASELMARYAIDEAVVWATSPGDGSVPTEIRMTVYRPFTAQKAVLVHSVANVLGCQTLRLGQVEEGTGELMSIVGFPGDLALVETLVTSLFVQLTTAMTAPGAARGRTASQVAAWRRSFIMGFTDTVAERLASDRRRVADEADEHAPSAGQPSTAVVLRDRSSVVDADFRRRYPRIRTARVSAGTSAAGRHAGTTAGRSADLGNRRLQNRHALHPGR